MCLARTMRSSLVAVLLHVRVYGLTRDRHRSPHGEYGHLRRHATLGILSRMDFEQQAHVA